MAESGIFIRHSKAAKKKAAPSSLPLVRTGIPSLDHIFQGGLPLSSIVLIQEDSLNYQSLQIARCFLGEGVINSEKIFVYSDAYEENLVPDIRKIKKQESAELRIAWRYEHYPQTSSVKEPYAFDLLKSMGNEKINQYTIDVTEQDLYRKLWSQIFSDIQNSLESANDTGIRRIFIKSFLGPSWPKAPISEIFQFLQSLKLLVKSLNAICMITSLTSGLETELVTLLNQSCDIVLSTENFAISGDSFGDYSGLLRIIKCPRIHSLKNIDFDALAFGIKLDRRHIAVESLSLPPADSLVPTKESMEF
ncbi:unnamed protein product [Blepharisma stoltei]|uniref:Elongator complex protein 4 n=1 Tax=Blepharisma stoltei TaxID=1481888 RepID=A0AAU9IJI0_9CILI|nr:unnamed protein product [Blepharisma stoltei]